MDKVGVLNLLEEAEVAVFATVTADGNPRARHARIGLANEEGIFFMTSPKTPFYAQLMANPNIAITGMLQKEGLIHVLRVEGRVRPLGKEQLEAVLAGNPFVKDVYPDDQERASVQVFQVYEGQLFYQSLTEHIRLAFDLGQNKPLKASKTTRE